MAAALPMICGKIAVGKSTLAAQLEGAGALRLSEDTLLAALYPEELRSPKDYVQYSARLRAAIGPHVVGLLQAGVPVVLDFPANTVANRDWMRGLFTEAGADHQLHLLNVPDEVCLARLHARNAAGDHPFAATEEQFRLFSAHYLPPSAEEGFTVVTHG
jgi:predicted kinase